MTGRAESQRWRAELKAKLRAHEFLVGVLIKAPNPAAVEMCGHLGLDLVLLDAEHGAGGTSDLEHHMRAADSAGIGVVVRVAGNDASLILQALDAGAAGVAVPHVSNAKDAQRAVEAAHYPPLGRRSFATTTHAGRQGSASMEDHLEHSARETVVAVQIEDAEGASAASEIAAVDGVDMLWLGFNDLDLDLRRHLQLSEQAAKSTVDDLMAACTTPGHPPLAVIGGRNPDMAAWRDRGVTVVLVTLHDILNEGLGRIVTSRQAVREAPPIYEH